MEQIHKELPIRDLTHGAIESGKEYNVCLVSGKLATDLCAQDVWGDMTSVERYTDSTAPTEYCSSHREFTVCYLDPFDEENRRHPAKDTCIPSYVHTIITSENRISPNSCDVCERYQ